MFKNLRTSTKLVVLCGTFVVAVGATTYSLVAEKQIAIEFARKELVGSTYLAAVRGVYAAILVGPPFEATSAQPAERTDDILKRLAAAQSRTGNALHSAELAAEFAELLRPSRPVHPGGGSSTDTLALDALAKAQQLIARIADDSNLALDPDLDSYHVQDLVTRKLPAFLGRLGELQLLARAATASPSPSSQQQARVQVLAGLLQSTAAEVNKNLAAAYRGNPDGRLRQAVAGAFAMMMANTKTYLGGSDTAAVEGGEAVGKAAVADHVYGAVVDSAIGAWAAAQSELDRLLHARIDGFVEKLLLSLALTAALLAFSILVAVMTHRQIVRPLERLEAAATTVRQTKNYNLRIDDAGKNEIGQLTAAFNDMLSELAAARDRERAELAEFARAARLTTVGTMTASIAHEINQPLAAIIANSNAAQRWLSRAEPDLEEARTALRNIVKDGHRASEVIGSVRAMFKKDSGEKVPLVVNDIIKDVFPLIRGDLRRQRISVRRELARDLPHVVGDRIQLLQVFTNLIRNAVEAMGAVADHERLLLVRSAIHDPAGVMVTVEDTGTGIDRNNAERIFDAFFTTKSDGMGMGLSICRSIIEAHGGRLWASPGESRGSVFHVVLPGSKA